jgi:uncharacterized metal-binding protein
MNTPISNAHELAKLGQAGLQRRKAEGLHTGIIPLGYMVAISEEGRRIMVIDPDTAPLVRKVFELQGAGQSLRAIQREVTRLGLRSKRGGVLSVSAIHHVLTCPTYRGLVRGTDGSLQPGQHDALVELP